MGKQLNSRLTRLEQQRHPHGIFVVFTDDGKTYSTSSNGKATMTQGDVEAVSCGRRLVIVSYDKSEPVDNGA